MRHPLLLTAAVAIAAIPVGILACSEQRTHKSTEAELKTFDVGGEPPPNAVPDMPQMASMPPVAPPPPPPARDVPAAASLQPGPAPMLTTGTGAILPEVAPRVAYSYGYRFRVPAANLAGVQERHINLCLSMGQARCRIVSMRRGETRAAPRPDRVYPAGEAQPDTPAASLEVQVAASVADEFGRRLTSTTGDAGGQTVDRQIGGDDVSREMVDSEARIRTREVLIRRLSALLATRSGNIQQAVEAERAINQAQEELEAARAWLAETRGRVAMSRIAIAYETGAAAAPAADPNPLATAARRVAAFTVQSLAALLLVAGIVAPWALIVLLIVFAARWHRRRTEAADAGLAPSLPTE
jgi:hypothetical protein